jgi:hypothetical protein
MDGGLGVGVLGLPGLAERDMLGGPASPRRPYAAISPESESDPTSANPAGVTVTSGEMYPSNRGRWHRLGSKMSRPRSSFVRAVLQEIAKVAATADVTPLHARLGRKWRQLELVRPAGFVLGVEVIERLRDLHGIHHRVRLLLGSRQCSGPW